MKRVKFFSCLGIVILLMTAACKNSAEKKTAANANSTLTDTTGYMPVGKNIITEIILKPDTTGDPWEVEKVKGFSGEKLFKTLFDHIYSGKFTVYDCRIDKALTVSEIKDLEKEFATDFSRIGKVQFAEDWFFDTNKNTIVKRIKSISFGFTMDKSPDMPPRYKALFRIKQE